MKRLLLSSICFVLSIVSSSPVLAGELELSWKDPNKYSDVRAAEENKHRFQKRVLNEIEKHLTRLALKLPNNTKIKIEISNVDLAGNIEYVNSKRIRVLKDMYIPKISLSYVLLDENNKVALTGEEKLKNWNYLQRGTTRYQHEFLAHEKSMMTKWFNATFIL